MPPPPIPFTAHLGHSGPDYGRSALIYTPRLNYSPTRASVHTAAQPQVGRRDDVASPNYRAALQAQHIQERAMDAALKLLIARQQEQDR